MLKNNLLIVHGGGPTAVLNCSLYGAVSAALKSDQIKEVFGARNGIEGILKEDFIRFTDKSEEMIEKLLLTPGTAIGSSRYPICDDEYEKIVDILLKNHIRYVLFTGGNGTMDTCGKLNQATQKRQAGIFVIGIPKTMDNDIARIDHSPGYGSAARFAAAITNEIAIDVKSLPIHVVIIELMGRNAGWVAAAASLSPNKPDLIYLPERAFDEKAFLNDVKDIYDQKGYAVVVVSEGLVNEQGESIIPPIYQMGRSIYYGDVSAYLSELVIKELGIKSRHEKPGLLGRASMAYRSDTDISEAICVGKKAVEAVLNHETGKMVGLSRIGDDHYQIDYPLIPIKEVMLHEEQMPAEFVSEVYSGVEGKFFEWCQPLIGQPLPDLTCF